MFSLGDVSNKRPVNTHKNKLLHKFKPVTESRKALFLFHNVKFYLHLTELSTVKALVMCTFFVHFTALLNIVTIWRIPFAGFSNQGHYQTPYVQYISHRHKQLSNTDNKIFNSFLIYYLSNRQFSITYTVNLDRNN